MLHVFTTLTINDENITFVFSIQFKLVGLIFRMETLCLNKFEKVLEL